MTVTSSGGRRRARWDQARRAAGPASAVVVGLAVVSALAVSSRVGDALVLAGIAVAVFLFVALGAIFFVLAIRFAVYRREGERTSRALGIAGLVGLVAEAAILIMK